MDCRHLSTRIKKSKHSKRIRDYKAEYRRRIESGKARGYSRSQSAGHPNLRTGESHITAKNKTAFPQDTPQDDQKTRLMVATSPCLGCTCKESPATCKRLEDWIKNSLIG